MKVTITKKADRNILTCQRNDGSFTQSHLGPDFPNHDIAHFVIEKHFNLQKGFFGLIKSGHSIEQLSDKEVIKTLDREIWLSEVLSRNLQSLGSGIGTAQEYLDIVEWETKAIGNIPQMEILPETIEQIKINFDQLWNEWDNLPDEGTLSLHF